MSAKEKAFQKKVDALIRQADKLEDAAVRRVLDMLSDARQEVAAQVASTDWQAYRLSSLKASIERSMTFFGDKYGVDLREAQRSFWEDGIARLDAPLREIGIYAAFPAIDTTALSILQGYSTDLVKGLADDAARAINRELAQTLLGQKTPFEAMKAIGRNLDSPGIFGSVAKRAEVILRNEAKLVLEASSQARFEQFEKLVPGLKKQWQHSHRSRMPRISHLAADGQVKDVKDFFTVGGEKLMFPRDPRGSARNTINCGCSSVPWHADWDLAVERQAA